MLLFKAGPPLEMMPTQGLVSTAPVAWRWTSGRPTASPRLTPATPAVSKGLTGARAPSVETTTKTRGSKGYVTKTGATLGLIG